MQISPGQWESVTHGQEIGQTCPDIGYQVKYAKLWNPQIIATPLKSAIIAMVLDGNHKWSSSCWKPKVWVLRRKLGLATDYRNSLAGSELILPPPQWVSHSTNCTTQKLQIAQSNSAETQAVFGYRIQSLTTSINLVAYGKRRKNYKKEFRASPPPMYWNSWCLGYIGASCWPLGVMVTPPKFSYFRVEWWQSHIKRYQFSPILTAKWVLNSETVNIIVLK